MISAPIKRLVMVVLYFMVVSNCTEGQETRQDIKKNVIKLSAATMGMINGMVSIDYERNILFRENLMLNVEATYGKYYQTYTRETFQSLPAFHSFTAGFNTLIGGRSHHFEASFGVRYSIINDDYYAAINPFYPVINAGYRYQNPSGKGLIFRIFAGTTGIGMSAGKSF
jgi:hypothetical protein